MSPPYAYFEVLQLQVSDGALSCVQALDCLRRVGVDYAPYIVSLYQAQRRREVGEAEVLADAVVYSVDRATVETAEGARLVAVVRAADALSAVLRDGGELLDDVVAYILAQRGLAHCAIVEEEQCGA